MKRWSPIRRSSEARLAAWGFLLNLGWEFAQTPLYADSGQGLGYLAWTRVHCTLGDVLILLGGFWLTALAFRDRRWFLGRRHRVAAVLFVATGLLYTAWSEWFNTSLRAAWAYGPEMPRLFGLGLTPLLQWLLLPPILILLLQRRQRAAGRRPSTSKGDRPCTAPTTGRRDGAFPS